MNGRSLIVPLLAAGILAFVMLQTGRAMERSGTWSARRPKTALVQQEDPYVRLDRMIASASSAPESGLARDPFFAGSTAPVALAPLRSRRVVVPGPPPKPVLTAIVWDNDARALVRWNGRDYTIRTNDLFDQFRVQSISREQVVLDRHGELMILKRPHQGE